MQHGWQGKKGWVLVGTGVLPLQNIIAQLKPPIRSVASSGGREEDSAINEDDEEASQSDPLNPTPDDDIGDSESRAQSKALSSTAVDIKMALYREIYKATDSSGGWGGLVPPATLATTCLAKPSAGDEQLKASEPGQTAAASAHNPENFNTLESDLTLVDLTNVCMLYSHPSSLRENLTPTFPLAVSGRASRSATHPSAGSGARGRRVGRQECERNSCGDLGYAERCSTGSTGTCE